MGKYTKTAAHRGCSGGEISGSGLSFANWLFEWGRKKIQAPLMAALSVCGGQEKAGFKWIMLNQSGKERYQYAEGTCKKL